MIHRAEYVPVSTEMIPPFMAGPIAAGLCTLHECKTSLSLPEIWALNELMLVKAENERRAHRAAEAKSRS